jgi:Rhodopirellula transposase DDE domain
VVAKKFYQPCPIKTNLIGFIDSHKAGSPTDPTVFWIHLKPREISSQFFEQYQQKVSNGTVKRLLKELGYSYRKMSKTLATGIYLQRDEQFKLIMAIIFAMSLKNPIISIDCKKKERLGNLYRDGKCYTTGDIDVFDHDYDNLSEGKVIPHGIYDLQLNKGFISIGSSSETAEFITDNLRWWWTEFGIHSYPDAQNILILCDAGGGNSYRHHIFKIKILELAKEIGISIVIAHYPPYSSKYNPIEHRLFCHVHNAIKGVVFSNYNIVKELMEKTSTIKGLSVVVRLNLTHYQKGIIVDKSQMETKRIFYNKDIPQLSYKIIP